MTESHGRYGETAIVLVWPVDCDLVFPQNLVCSSVTVLFILY